MRDLFISLLEQTDLALGTQLVMVQIILALIIILLVLVARGISKLIIRFSLQKIIRKSKFTWDDVLYDRGVFKRLANYLPALILYLLFPLFFPEINQLTDFIQRLIIAYMITVTILLIDSFLEAADALYKTYGAERAKKKPIKVYLQVIKIFIYIIGAVLIITKLMNVSPVGILSGIGAMSAVLLLVFKDSIMGFVSSMQLSANDMVRIGDWIEMPKYGADGDIIDITLQSIKVRNWDMTITTIPIYALISDSFKNWRGMSESEGRRIKRSLSIDMRSVGFLKPEQIARLKKLPLLKDYLEVKEKDIAAYNQSRGIDPEDLVSARRLTNLGTFRAYVKAYLDDHPMVSKKLIHMVRYLDPGPTGIPMELYLFCVDKAWVNYESVQADIFDHLLAVLPQFGLKVFQEPSGWDLQSIAENLKS